MRPGRRPRVALAFPFLAFLAALPGGCPPAGAVSPKTWTVGSQKEFLEGEAQGLRLTAAGTLELGPRFEEKAALEEPVVWAVAAAGSGDAIWIGTGSSGRLLRVSGEGQVSEAARFDELQVTSLLADGDAVFAATSPLGGIYRVVPGRDKELVVRPGAQYIWALARGEDGTLYAATGTEGQVYAVKGHAASVLYDSPDLHVMSLATGPGGTLIAGTYERGLVLSIDSRGTATVLHDSGLKETRAVAVGPDGTVYAAINGGATFRDAGQAPSKPPPAEGATVTVVAGGDEPRDTGGGGSIALPPPEALGEVQSEVVRIAPGSPAEVIARTRGELLYALALAPGGELLIGTSKRLLVPAGPGPPAATLPGWGGEDVTVVALSLDGGTAQVSTLQAAGQRVLAGTTGPSRVYVLAAGREREGRYTSRVFAAEGEAEWGSLHADAAVPAGASLAVETRSGRTQEPDSTWSAWAAVAGDPLAGARVTSPASRYLQWRVVLRSPPGGTSEAGTASPDPGGAAAGGPRRPAAGTPVVRSVGIGYQPRNLRPVIKSFSAQPPGVLFQRSNPVPAVVESAPPPLPSMFEELGAARPEPAAAGKRLYRRGVETLVWDVSDPNDDELRVKLSIRRRDGGPQLVVRERAESNAFSFDTEVLPDGWYLPRIDVDDSASNPAPGALAAGREGEPFRVDNTPPRVSLVTRKVEGRRATLSFHAGDAMSPLWKAEWALDGGGFVPVFAQDGITDSLEESYVVATGDLGPGEHLVVLHVFDLANQSASAEALVEIR